MSNVKKNKKNVYKRRQSILITVIGIILIALILVLVYFVAFNNNKKISQNVNNSLLENSEAVPVGGQEGNINNNSIQFVDDSITIEVGEKKTPKFNIDNVDNVFEWKSSDKSVAIVSEKGEITGVSVGTAKISANIKNTDITLELNVEVIPSTSGNFSTNGYEIVEKNGITYIDGILIANKTYGLPKDYNPDVNDEALAAFEEMQADAEEESLDIYIASGFRSYEDQDRIYNNYASVDGYEAADTYSARPGYSEHQTGLAFDLNSIETSFAYTAEGEWVKNNAHKYGFIIRYPEDKEDITGYQYEPWHIRYIGVEKATEVYESGLCLEEFLGVDSVYADTKTESTENTENEEDIYSEE